MSFNETDYELLSAYIDEMLEDDERSALEARLQQEPELRRELSALRQTVTLVQQLPALRAPRDFTLTAEMVGNVVRKPPPPRLLFMPLLSAAAAVMLMVMGVLLLLADTNGGDRATTASEPLVGGLSNMTLQDETSVAAAPTATLEFTPEQATADVAAAEEASAADADTEAMDEAEVFADEAETEPTMTREPMPTATRNIAQTATALLEVMSTSSAAPTVLPNTGGGIAGTGPAEADAQEEAESEAPADDALPEADAPSPVLAVPEIAATQLPTLTFNERSAETMPQAALAATADPTASSSPVPGRATSVDAGDASGAGDGPLITTEFVTATMQPTPQPTATLARESVRSVDVADIPLLPLALIGAGGLLLVLSGWWWWTRRS